MIKITRQILVIVMSHDKNKVVLNITKRWTFIQNLRVRL